MVQLATPQVSAQEMFRTRKLKFNAVTLDIESVVKMSYAESSAVELEVIATIILYGHLLTRQVYCGHYVE